MQSIQERLVEKQNHAPFGPIKWRMQICPSTRDRTILSIIIMIMLMMMINEVELFSSFLSTGSTTMDYSIQNDYQQSIQDLNILLFITTVFSQDHMELFNCCWPRLMEYSPLLPNVHVIVFANNSTEEKPENDMEHIQSLFVHNPSFQFQFVSKEVGEIYETMYQEGAQLPLRLASENGWFKQYDWVIRINPDVLIRDSDWLVQTMKNETVDGIFSKCWGRSIHTDFFAIRSMMFHNHSFSEMIDGNHERGAYENFKPALESGRYALVPVPDSRGICRIGHTDPENAIIFHSHGRGICVTPTEIEPSSVNNQSQPLVPPSPVCKDLEGWPRSIQNYSFDGVLQFEF